MSEQPRCLGICAALKSRAGFGFSAALKSRLGFGISAALKSRNTVCTCVFAVRRMLRVKKTPKAHGGAWVLLAALCAMLFFWRLGAIPLIGFDEGSYAECSREMLAGGDYVVPTCNGEPFYDKPPLAYWLQAASMRAFGVNSFAARLPSAVESLALVVLTVFLGTRLFSRRVGLMAGFALATCTLAVGLARLAIIDALFSLTITASLGAFLLGYVSSTRDRQPHTPARYAIAFWSAMGFSVMVKGPAGAVLILATVLAFLLIRRDLRAIRRTMPIAGILLAAAIAMPWYVVVGQRTGGAFLREFIVHQNVQRALGKDFYHNAPFYYYVPVLLAGFFPWSVFLPAALLSKKKGAVSGSGQFGEQRSGADPARCGDKAAVGKRNPETPDPTAAAGLFLTVWIATIFVIFSVVRSKLPGYVYPIYPACALVVARLWSDATDTNDAGLRRDALASVVAACAAAAVMLIVAPFLKEPIPGVMTALMPMSAALVLGCAAAYGLARFGRPTTAFAALCAGMTFFLLVAIRLGLPIAARTYAIPAMKIGREIARRGGPAFALKLSPPQPQLGFYAGRPVRAVKLPSEMRIRRSGLVVVQDNCSALLPGVRIVEARIGPYTLLRYRR